MRVVIDARTVQDHFPGIGRYVYNLVLGLAAEAGNDRFLVLVNRSAPNTRYDLDALGRLPGLEVRSVAAPVFGLSEQVRLPGLALDWKADLWHAPFYIRPYALPVPAATSILDLIPKRFPELAPDRKSRLLYSAAIRLAVARSRHLITISRASAADLRTLYGVPAGRITAIPLAADAAFAPQSAATIAAVRARLNLPERYVLYLGSNKPHKNLVRLIEAWGLLGASDGTADHVLVIAGQWDERYPESRQTCRALGIKSVTFAGPVAEPDLAGLYAGATLFVFPSLYEGFGLPVLESMASGTPVACANTSSLPEVAGSAALLFDPLQPAEMAAAIGRALGDAALRDDLRGGGLARAATFNWRRTAQAHLSVYRSVAASSEDTT